MIERLSFRSNTLDDRYHTRWMIDIKALFMHMLYNSQSLVGCITTRRWVIASLPSRQVFSAIHDCLHVNAV